MFDPSTCYRAKSTMAIVYIAQVQSSAIGSTPKQVNSRLCSPKSSSARRIEASVHVGTSPYSLSKAEPTSHHNMQAAAGTYVHDRACTRRGKPKADQCPASKERKSVGMSRLQCVWPLLHERSWQLESHDDCLHCDVSWGKRARSKGALGKPPRALWEL